MRSSRQGLSGWPTPRESQAGLPQREQEPQWPSLLAVPQPCFTDPGRQVSSRVYGKDTALGPDSPHSSLGSFQGCFLLSKRDLRLQGSMMGPWHRRDQKETFPLWCQSVLQSLIPTGFCVRGRWGGSEHFQRWLLLLKPESCVTPSPQLQGPGGRDSPERGNLCVGLSLSHQ